MTKNKYQFIAASNLFDLLGLFSIKAARRAHSDLYDMYCDTCGCHQEDCDCGYSVDRDFDYDDDYYGYDDDRSDTSSQTTNSLVSTTDSNGTETKEE